MLLDQQPLTVYEDPGALETLEPGVLVSELDAQAAGEQFGIEWVPVTLKAQCLDLYKNAMTKHLNNFFFPSYTHST